jgi:hypothetical protein
MSPGNPTTRLSLREPKLKEPEVGEVSSPGATKQLEYNPRLELVFKTTTKKVFIQPPAFGDTEASTGSNMALPHWGELFNKIIQEEYLEYVLHSDPHVRALDEKVFSNIRWSYLHMVARRTLVFPYIEVLKWLIDHTEIPEIMADPRLKQHIEVLFLSETLLAQSESV